MALSKNTNNKNWRNDERKLPHKKSNDNISYLIDSKIEDDFSLQLNTIQHRIDTFIGKVLHRKFEHLYKKIEEIEKSIAI